MKTSSFRNTYAQISLQALKENAASFKASLQSPACRLMAVVKGDGYGHGAVAAARSALNGGADYLGVAILDEAIELRDAGVEAPILVLGYTSPHALREAISRNITLTVFSTDVRDALLEVASEAESPIKVHIKTETGMGRVGVQTKEELLDVMTPLYKHNNIEVEGIFTHFAEADNLQSTYTDEQFARFLSFIEAIEKDDMHVPIKHCCNSAGTLFHKDKHLDMVRVGISLYGLRPDLSLQFPIELTQAMRLFSSIVSLRKLPEGSSISYGRTHKLSSEKVVATMPIGYADGLSRALSNKGFVTLHGQKAPILGRVCMDQTMIDVTDIPDAALGDHVEFPIDEMAELTGTINYEIVCAVSKRVPRYYEEN
ncbi:alanine racemase [Alkalihalophilus pseudofirmus]|uniref:Alanine racemase n=1 Tax=Alkalihalophilus pseudofirmus TaxID=79885 RepID=A0AAJ2NQQ3_ALKPS|nr:alanine racemase [Alkalihalophilus pseudofirmus]MDV2886751.1 alanine racemase [Alkalihalophilus pseudofirmus]